VLSDIPVETDPRVLVDFRTADDAGVYAWESGPALVQTVDFFTPIVDDPYVYGEIAAANSLSDVYAMGGRPLTALAVAGFPEDLVDAETIALVFKGGHDTLRRAGVVLLGGHTVRDREIKFGYAVTGAVSPNRIWRNAGARVGDVLILTKAIGTGIVGTAIKFDRAPAGLAAVAVASMRTLNQAAAEAVAGLDVHACTDVTGFGLLGHASEMAAASAVSMEIDAGAVPLFDGVLELVGPNRSGGLHSNRRHFGDGIELRPSVPPALADLLYDPQTSGGLLLALAPQDGPVATARLRAHGALAAQVGVVLPRRESLLTVR
jgi:selenide, water dikinase